MVVFYLRLDDLPSLTTATAVGIVVAITGNILISLALNLQKLAHKKVEAKHQAKIQAKAISKHAANHNAIRESNENDLDHDGQNSENLNHPDLEITQSLIESSEDASETRNYGSTSNNDTLPRPVGNSSTKNSFMSQLIPTWKRSRKNSKSIRHVHAAFPVDIIPEEALHGLPSPRKKPEQKDDDEDGVKNEGDYLQSKLWWLGFLLMNVGEVGNFISYAYAPASVVAPLGTFALMANCLFSPLLLGERFRKRDLLGIGIAIIGAVTVVLSTNASNTRLNPDALIRAICQTPFIVYTGIYIGGAIVLSTLSEGRIGRDWVFVDVGLCSLFGGFTVLSTKALSTLLTMEWIEVFTKWITYPILAVLVLTGVGQIRYLNRALMRFDSKVVIPIQFVLFTLSAIIGSAILYGDFKKAKFHEIVTFLYGCAATFLGVFIIAWSRNQSDMDSRETAPTEEESSTSGTNTDGLQPALGTLGRRRAALILPSGVGSSPSLRRQRSSIGIMAISPAQHLLLVHTPPQDYSFPRLPDEERDSERPGHNPSFNGRQRTLSWFGSDRHNTDGGEGGSVNGRSRNGASSNTRLTRVGSLPDRQTIYR